jgi:signal transduction histidine kinase
VLQQGAKDDPRERDRFLGVVERQTQRLSGLVRAMLTLARAQADAEAVRLEDVELSPVLLGVVEEVTSSDRSMTCECPPGLAVRAHSELLRQALDNLIENAFTHGGGRDVRLTARSTAVGIVPIAVSDDGPGMTSSAASRAVERFYRDGNGQGGFGLGLAIVREVVQVMDGELSIRSAPGRGTTVSIELAVSHEPGASA